MAKCPSCGKEVETPIKEWDIPWFPRLGKTRVKMYECCRKKFRDYVRR